MCIRYLNKAPYTVSNNDWNQTLNTILPNIIDVEVKKETDTSGLSELHNAFIYYIANKQSRRDSPFQIHMGLCVRQAVNGVVKYYFTTQGFIEYLRNSKISFDLGMLRETLKGFGVQEDVLVYTSALGEERRFPCWSKAEDNVIEETYKGFMEVEEGDKANIGAVSVSEATNTAVEEKQGEEKSYSEEDFNDAQNLF